MAEGYARRKRHQRGKQRFAEGARGHLKWCA